MKIRKGDVHAPKGSFFSKHVLRRFEIRETKITEIGSSKESAALLIFVHGGAFVSGPGQHHWDTIKTLAQQVNCKIWMCDYPKAPESKISKISENLDAIYQSAIDQFDTSKISMIGDSVGGTLIAALVQRLVAKKISLPGKLVLVSPVMDASMSNTKIAEIEKLDPMLSAAGVLSAKEMCAENKDLKNPIISPLNGSFEGFPATYLYLAEHDITFPDQKLAAEKIAKAQVDLKVIEGKNMPHIWPFLPVMKESKEALEDIVRNLNS